MEDDRRAFLRHAGFPRISSGAWSRLPTYPYKIFDVPPTRLSLFGSFTHAVVI